MLLPNGLPVAGRFMSASLVWLWSITTPGMIQQVVVHTWRSRSGQIQTDRVFALEEAARIITIRHLWTWTPEKGIAAPMAGPTLLHS